MSRLDPEAEDLARGALREAVVVDGLLYGPAADRDEYFREVLEAGVTATNVTIPAVTDDLARTLERLDHWRRRVERNREWMAWALSAADIENAKREGRTAVIPGTQDAVHLDGDIKNAARLREAGIRILQLTYQRTNAFGSGCGVPEGPGLTPAGRELVRELNDLRVLIDLSHCGYRTTFDAIEASARPCAFTHANAKALCDHPRNKTDDQIRALAERGGVMGIVTYSPFSDVRGDRRPTIAEYLDIVEYAVEKAGIDHVGIGLDFTPTWTDADYAAASSAYPEIYCGYPRGEEFVRGLRRVADLRGVSRGLAARGFFDEEIRKILGGNFLRLFREVWGG